MADVVCLGELLIDFTSLSPGASIVDTPGFEKNAGGAPANVAAGVARLGGSSAFLGMVGNDEFGYFLSRTLADCGVDVSGLRFSDKANTTLAFVALREDGEREFIFYRNPGADMLYAPDDINHEIASGCRIFYHGSISLMSPANREATIAAASMAHQNGALIICDPNIRLNLWHAKESAREAAILGVQSADIAKVSEEELEFITGYSDILSGMKALRDLGPSRVIVTQGSAGCTYSWIEYNGTVTSEKQTVVDATGAGDAFIAGMIYRLTQMSGSLDVLGHDNVRDMLSFANTVAGLCVRNRGAIPATPTLNDVMVRGNII